MSLTYKQRAFVEHFLGDAQWNATEAARRAGYKHPNMAGPRLLVNDSVQRHITDRLHAMGASAEALMGRWLTRIEADISPFVDRSGLNVEELKQAGLGHLIKGVRKTQHVTNIELRDPDKAEEMLAKHLGMFVERHELRGPDGGPIPIKYVVFHQPADEWSGDRGDGHEADDGHDGDNRSQAPGEPAALDS